MVALPSSIAQIPTSNPVQIHFNGLDDAISFFEVDEKNFNFFITESNEVTTNVTQNLLT